VKALAWLVAAVLAASLFSTPATADAATVPTSGQLVSGLDVHDGMISKVGSTYFLYGTEYGCGFSWGTPGTPWCGFGVWTSKDKLNWTYGGDLFDPAALNAWRGLSWQDTCAKYSGGGCFNPRIVQRTDGKFILWFNAPEDFSRLGANAYYAMGCTGPAGPCGGPGEVTNKPRLYTCSGNGDFSITYVDRAYIVCTMQNQTIRVEPLDRWWTNGTGGGLANVGGLTGVESPAVFGAGPYLYMTYSGPNCGYCSGTGSAYLWSSTGMGGPWHQGGRFSSESCGGQPRSLGLVDGGVVTLIDLWTPSGAKNQATASLWLEDLHLNFSWRLEPLTCE